MMRLISIFLFLLFQLFLIAQTNFQPTGNLKKDQQAVKILEDYKEIELASNYYSKLLANPKLSPSQQLQIGINYLKVSKFIEAIDVFKLIVNNNYSKLPMSRYYLASSFFRNNDFDLARAEFKTFIDNFSFESDSFKNEVRLQMYECDSMNQKSKNKSAKILVQLDALTSMNSPSQDNQSNLYLVEHTVAWQNEERNGLLVSQNIVRVDLDSSVSREVFDVNSNLKNDVFISEDGNIIVYTETVSTEKATNTQIKYCRKTAEGWDKPILFSNPINIEGYNCKSPTLLKLNRDYYLIYSSDKPGGYGGYDIYMTELNSDFNSVADSILPAKVNTSFDEISPFFNKRNSTLYFSSNRLRDNFGGLDIYSFKEGVSENAINLGMPYNSGADDCYFRMHERKGYFFSNRKSDTNKSLNNVYSFETEKNNLNINVSSNYNELTSYTLSVDEDNLRIYSSDTSNLHSIEITPNHSYKIKLRKDNYVGIDSTLTITKLGEGETINLSLSLEPIISIEGKVYFVDYDSSAPKIKQCIVELIDISNTIERVLYTTIINKQNRKYSFVLPTDKKVKLKVKATDYSTYDTTFVLSNFKSPGGFINNIQLHQIQKNNIIFLDSMFVLDDEIRTYNDFDQSIRPEAFSFNKNEEIKAELTIQLVTSDYSKNDFALPSSIEDVLNKYFTKNIYINKQVIKVKSTSRNQEWYKLYLTYK